MATVPRIAASATERYCVADRLSEILEGGLGFFWPVVSGSFPDLETDEPRSGYIRRDDDAVSVVLLVEDASEAFETPEAIGLVGYTQHGGVLIPDVYRTGTTMSFGGGRASVHRYVAHSVLGDIKPLDATCLDLDSVSMDVNGNSLLQWGGFEAVDQSATTDEHNRVQELQIKLKNTPDLTVPLNASTTLRLAAHWSTSQDSQRSLSIEMGLRVSIMRTGSSSFDLLTRLRQVQDLLGLAYDGHIVIDHMQAGSPGQEHGAPMWSGALMSDSPPALAADRGKPPMFSLFDVGGAVGVRRWMKLYDRFPRSVAPVSNYIRYGSPSPEVRLLEVAAAIEQWVATHRRSTQWASRGINVAAALAQHVGVAFTDWAGPADLWATQFWDSYNDLKHLRGAGPSHREAFLAAETGYRLLVAALLDRVAGSKQPSRQMLSDYRLREIGKAMRDELGVSA
ncbi:MAG: hypothetical protein IIC71_12810 [Acidobacteria bacterium]|nr:hypothetical protein [Acidobacteriota bacterium]